MTSTRQRERGNANDLECDTCRFERSSMHLGVHRDVRLPAFVDWQKWDQFHSVRNNTHSANNFRKIFVSHENSQIIKSDSFHIVCSDFFPSPVFVSVNVPALCVTSHEWFHDKFNISPFLLVFIVRAIWGISHNVRALVIIYRLSDLITRVLIPSNARHC